MKRKFGIEYARGVKFPNVENRYDDVPDIPDTLKNYDSFKFDRSIEKAEKYENGNVFKRFEDRSTTDPESKLKGYFTSWSVSGRCFTYSTLYFLGQNAMKVSNLSVTACLYNW